MVILLRASGWYRVEIRFRVADAESFEGPFVCSRSHLNYRYLCKEGNDYEKTWISVLWPLGQPPRV